MVEKLTSRRANVEQTAANGWKPLHFAAVSAEDPVNTVRALLDAHADVMATTDLGKSALHLAVEAGNIEIVQLESCG